MTEIDYAVETMASDLVMLLIDDKKVTLEEALDILYNSKTYQNLKCEQSGLYYQSPRYVYSFLKDEINKSSQKN